MGWIKTKYPEGHICQGQKRKETGAWALGHVQWRKNSRSHPGPAIQRNYTKNKTTGRLRLPSLGSTPVYDQSKKDLGPDQDFPTLGKNLFIDLAERTAHEFNVTDCWVTLWVKNGLGRGPA